MRQTFQPFVERDFWWWYKVTLRLREQVCGEQPNMSQDRCLLTVRKQECCQAWTLFHWPRSQKRLVNLWESDLHLDVPCRSHILGIPPKGHGRGFIRWFAIWTLLLCRCLRHWHENRLGWIRKVLDMEGILSVCILR